MNGADHGFFVKLRYRCDAPGPFEGQLAQVARRHGWHVAFADYDLVDDLGKDRFLAAEQLSANSATSSQTLRGQRAERVAQFLYQTLLLAMDALVQDGTGWRFEKNQDQENSTGSTFQSIVHLVCNLTQARSHAVVSTPAGNFLVERTF